MVRQKLKRMLGLYYTRLKADSQTKVEDNGLVSIIHCLKQIVRQKLKRMLGLYYTRLKADGQTKVEENAWSLLYTA